MDDENLKKILLEQNIPEIDTNAKKRALNLALSAFEEEKLNKNNNLEKNNKKLQGFSFLSRLINKTQHKTNTRSTLMEKKTKKKFMYGGMATAMAVILVTGVSLTQLQQTGSDNSLLELSLSSSLQEAPVNEVELRRNNTALRSDEESLPASGRENPQDKIKAQKNLILKGTTQQKHKDQTGEKTSPSTIAHTEMDHHSVMPSPSLMQERKTGSAVPQALTFSAKKQQIPSIRSRSKEHLPPVFFEAAPSISGDAVFGKAELSDASDIISAPYFIEEGRDKFEDFSINTIKSTQQEPVSTFSVDVDTASYSFVRKKLNQGSLPTPQSVRIEEMINYFDYNYALPEDKDQPFKASVNITDSPWAEGKKLMHIGIKGYDVKAEQPRSNLVFLLDVSGSMNSADKLPLVKASMKMLLDRLQDEDSISIAVYAGAAGTVLEPTKVKDRAKILNAIDNLHAGGSTAGAAGIKLAYQLAQENFDKNAVNRVILATDGDFNIGQTSNDDLKQIIEEKRKSGIFLSVLGFGQGNLNDHLMQTIAQNGNGVAAYIDTLSEARKVLVEEASSTLFPIAKDVKIQVEFNPENVAEYRLIGYETRHLNREDFNNDKIDAGDIGAGHSVTAIYEITPKGSPALSVDPLRYSQDAKKANPKNTKGESHKASTEFSDEYAYLKIRYKLPTENTSKLITTPITEVENSMLWECPPCGPREKCSPCGHYAHQDTKFAIAVAGFAQILKGAHYTSDFSYDDVIDLATKNKGEDPFGYRAEFITLVKLAKSFDTAHR